MESNNDETAKLNNMEDDQEPPESQISNDIETTQSSEIVTTPISTMNHRIREDAILKITSNRLFDGKITNLCSPSSSLSLSFSNKKFSSSVPTTSQPLRISLHDASSVLQNTPNKSIKLPTLFQLCLSKLNESSISISTFKNIYAVRSYFEAPSKQITCKIDNVRETSAGLCTPNSLTSAPPSYSFVLRQMNLRRRPRFMGTFIPSPSFILRPPPPNYATAFDVYVDSPIPPPPIVYNYGFTSMPVICPECGYAGMSMITSRVTVCTHLWAAALCIFCCWICAPLPYVLRSCKNVYHYCRNCRNFLGMYCPTSQENMY
ncbi:unnamed protein product [Parnassius mnemosyne]|uniref:LITAF domain-containing protein n=1 Tax=Parnassius mnemosyne TaxID=213953 RepID=A0AAV1LE85_9NEOP